MDNWKNNSIWFEQIPDNLQAYLILKETKYNRANYGNIEYLTLWHHKSKLRNLSDINLPESLLYLDLTWSNIHSFIGIEQLPNLKRLELHYCTKLQSDSGLSHLSDSLEFLYISHCKKFVPNEELLSLKKLRTLCLNSCGNVESLDFLSNFPNLVDFRFVDTNVLNGDLSPLVEHPTIRNIGFIDKRHYNMKYDKLVDVLHNKNGGKEYKQIITFGKYETFRLI